MKETWQNLKTTYLYAKNQKSKLIKFCFCSVLSVFISIIVPILSANIIIRLTNNQFAQLIFFSIAIFLIENVRNFVRYFSDYYAQIIYRESFTTIQKDLGRTILKLETSIIDQYSSGVFIQRFTNDTIRLAEVFNILNFYLAQIMTDIGIFVAVFIINKVVFFYLGIMILLHFVIEKRKVKIYNEKDKIYRKKQEQASGFIGEMVRGVRDIKMLNAEKSFLDKLDGEIQDLNEKRYAMQFINNRYNLLRGFVSDLTDILLIALLVYFIIYHQLQTANALIIYNYAGRLPSIVNWIGMFLEKVKDFNLSASRVFAIMNDNEFKKEQFGVKKLKKLKGDFEFKNVSFAYEEKEILHHLNFKVHANETVAFVGKSGAGKTTIFNLLCKMYEPTQGEILLDNQEIHELDKDTIRGNITIISQNPYIFNMSIRDNLKLVKENLTEKEMIHACKMACLDEFIESLPEKYDTIVGEGGVTLSGGQRQRLAIARAFVQKTEIILFDEATSALDNETQLQIQKAIENMKKEYTILIIAHRLSTVINADRLLFIENGQVVAEGTHQELLKKNKSYKELYEIELQKD